MPYEIVSWQRGWRRLYNICSALMRWDVSCFFECVRKRYDVDVWHCTSVYPAGDFMVDYGNRYHQPYLLCATGVDIQKAPEIGYGVLLNPVVDARICSCLPEAQKLVAITESVTEEYRKLAIDEARISFIPNGVNVSRFGQEVDWVKAREGPDKLCVYQH